MQCCCWCPYCCRCCCVSLLFTLEIKWEPSFLYHGKTVIELIREAQPCIAKKVMDGKQAQCDSLAKLDESDRKVGFMLRKRE